MTTERTNQGSHTANLSRQAQGKDVKARTAAATLLAFLEDPEFQRALDALIDHRAPNRFPEFGKSDFGALDPQPASDRKPDPNSYHWRTRSGHALHELFSEEGAGRLLLQALSSGELTLGGLASGKRTFANDLLQTTNMLLLSLSDNFTPALRGGFTTEEKRRPQPHRETNADPLALQEAMGATRVLLGNLYVNQALK